MKKRSARLLSGAGAALAVAVLSSSAHRGPVFAVGTTPGGPDRDDRASARTRSWTVEDVFWTADGLVVIVEETRNDASAANLTFVQIDKDHVGLDVEALAEEPFDSDSRPVVISEKGSILVPLEDEDGMMTGGLYISSDGRSGLLDVSQDMQSVAAGFSCLGSHERAFDRAWNSLVADCGEDGAADIFGYECEDSPTWYCWFGVICVIDYECVSEI